MILVSRFSPLDNHPVPDAFLPICLIAYLPDYLIT